jgi:O-antigen ligase
MVIPLGIGVIGCARARGERTWPWTICTLIVLCAALLTVSRSAILGLFVVVVVMAWQWPVRRSATIFVWGSLALIVAWSLDLPVMKALVGLFANSPGDPSVRSRQIAAGYAFTHYDEHFWLGEGPGTYLTLRGHRILDNEYLVRLMDTGALGLTTYVLLLCIALALALRASAAPARDMASLAGGVSGSIAALIVAGLIFDYSGFEQAWYLGWFVIAVSAVVFDVSRGAGASSDDMMLDD